MHYPAPPLRIPGPSHFDLTIRVTGAELVALYLAKAERLEAVQVIDVLRWQRDPGEQQLGPRSQGVTRERTAKQQEAFAESIVKALRHEAAVSRFMAEHIDVYDDDSGKVRYEVPESFIAGLMQPPMPGDGLSCLGVLA